MAQRPRSWLLGVIVPLLIIVVILVADALEGPKTAYVGVLAVVPMFAAVFGTPLSTGIVGLITWLSAFAFGHLASDGNVTAQTVRLIIIALVVVLAIFAAYLRMKQEQRLAEAERAAAEASQFRNLADTDLLTEIPNRRGALRAIAERDWSGSRTIALFDVDNLKVVNDTHGHLAGDEYIRAVAGRLAGSISRTDVVARWGGDEFLVALDLPAPEAAGVLRRAHEAVTGRTISIAGNTFPASVSVGSAEWDAGQNLDDALSRADSALYQAKQAGRNRIASASVGSDSASLD